MSLAPVTALRFLPRRLGDLASLLAGRTHLGELTAVLARRYGERPAVHDPSPTPGLHPGGGRSFAALERHVARLAAAHAARGRAPGDRVMILVGNRVDVVLHALALARLGAVGVPVNPRLTSGEIAAVARTCGAGALVADDEVLADGDPPLPDMQITTTGARGLAAWLGAHPERREAPVGGDPDAVALLLATSGTTGTPKAAALTSRGLLAATRLLAPVPVGTDRGPRGGRDLTLAVLPLTHVMGLSVLLACLCAGVPLLRRASFDAGEVLDLIEGRRPNVFVGVPTMYADLDDAGAADRDLGSIQLWGSAADVMPEERVRRFQRYGAAARVAGRGVGMAAFVDVYGMVELSGAAALRVYPPSVSKAVPLPSVAVVSPSLEVRAVDGGGAPVSYGREGELQFRGTGVLAGYEGDDDAGPDDDGWFATGDHGRLWPGGVFQFVGRTADRLKVGGFSVFPAEVEEELRDLEQVVDVAVVGVPDDRLGERPAALVVPRDPPTFAPDSFLAAAEDRVAGYRRPREVVVTARIPRGNHGKVDRARATEMVVEHLAGRVEDG